MENAPVDARCRDSKISWSSLGSFGGEGPPNGNGLEGGLESDRSAAEVLRVRRLDREDVKR